MSDNCLYNASDALNNFQVPTRMYKANTTFSIFSYRARVSARLKPPKTASGTTTTTQINRKITRIPQAITLQPHKLDTHNSRLGTHNNRLGIHNHNKATQAVTNNNLRPNIIIPDSNRLQIIITPTTLAARITTRDLLDLAV